MASRFSKGGPPLRIIALPLARIKTAPGKKCNLSDLGAHALLVYYHFDLVSPSSGHKNLPWHKQVLEDATNKAADIWSDLGKAPKGSWRLWTYELGERVTDKIGFEEEALRSVDVSLGPTILAGTSTEQVSEDWRSRSLAKIPLIYPPTLYRAGAHQALDSPLTHLQMLLASSTPRHRWGFYLWMLITPLTLPFTLIPIVPNLPLFFCVWRSWSHYRAYRSSQYLSTLLGCGLIGPDPSAELDKLYTSFTPPRRNLRSVAPSGSSQGTSTFGENAADRKSEAELGTRASCAEYILLTREAMSQIVEMFRLPVAATMKVYRAMNQAHVRLRVKI